VVASLVRSNSRGSIGFLREPERINVLLSRARQGLILIGDSHTLLNASSPSGREHWRVVLDRISGAGGLLAGLSAVCQQHDRAIELLREPKDFALYAPDGGCSQPCNAVMPCGHCCPLRCHAYDREHARVRCMVTVYSYCSMGHLVGELLVMFSDSVLGLLSSWCHARDPGGCKGCGDFAVIGLVTARALTGC